MGLTQITYAEEILKVEDGRITVKRHIDGGVETVEGPLPIVITVNGSAAPCRPRNAKLLMTHKNAEITEWSVADIDGDVAQCGLSGSPTKVKAIQNIVFKAKESKAMGDIDAEIENLIVELVENHTIS